MVALAASLGMQRQARLLEEGDPVERAWARIVVRRAAKMVRDRRREHAYMIGLTVNGQEVPE